MLNPDYTTLWEIASLPFSRFEEYYVESICDPPNLKTLSTPSCSKDDKLCCTTSQKSKFITGMGSSTF